MKNIIIRRIEGKWYSYTLKPISEVEAIALGLYDRAGKEKVEARNKTKKP